MTVGPERPTNPLRHGVYTGSDLHMYGKTALISEAPLVRSGDLPGGEMHKNEMSVAREPGWLVQVDDLKHKHALGWWYYPQTDWKFD